MPLRRPGEKRAPLILPTRLVAPTRVGREIGVRGYGTPTPYDLSPPSPAKYTAPPVSIAPPPRMTTPGKQMSPSTIARVEAFQAALPVSIAPPVPIAPPLKKKTWFQKNWMLVAGIGAAGLVILMIARPRR